MSAARITTICLFALVTAAETSEQSNPDSAVNSSRQAAITSARAMADRARWVKRRRQFTARGVPYGVTGIPIGFISSDRQWTIGGRAHLVDLQQIPFRYKVMLGWTQDPVTGHRYNLRLLAPRLRGSDLGLLASADIGRSHNNFYGFGNRSSIDGLAAVSEYMMYRRRIGFQIRRWLTRATWIAVGGSWRAADISQKDTGLLARLLPDHLGHTRSASASVAVSWDSRDDPSQPERGTLHSWSLEVATSDLTGGLGSEQALRWTVMDRRYLPIRPNLLLLTRHAFEVVYGVLPLDAYGELGDPGRRVRSVGGDGSIRGLPQSRYQDDVRVLAGYELHRTLGSAFLFGQYIKWHIVSFLDVGRVFHRLSQVRPGGFHAGRGAGLHVVWDEDFIIRMEIARADQDRSTLIRLTRSY